MPRCPLCVDKPLTSSVPTADTVPAGDLCPRCGFSMVASQQLLDELSARAAERLKIPQHLVTAGTLLLELPVDSLGLIEFLVELEQHYKVNLMEDAWSEDVTCAEIVQRILQARRSETQS